jgi:hypothetical protein
VKEKLLVVILFFAGVCCFAQTNDSYGTVNALLKSGLNKNYGAIQDESVNLNGDERLWLYDDYAMSPYKMWMGAALNYFFGFGVGNFFQKDYLGGGVTLGGTVVGGTLCVVGYMQLLNAMNDTSPSSDSYLSILIEATNKFVLFYALGGSIAVASSVFGMVRIFTFPHSYNRKLSNALNINGLALNIEPSLDISGRGLDLALVRLSF